MFSKLFLALVNQTLNLLSFLCLPPGALMWEGATGMSSMFQTALMNLSSTVDFKPFGGGPFGGRTPTGAVGMAPAAVSNTDAGGGIAGALIWEGAIGTDPGDFRDLKLEAEIASSRWFARSALVTAMRFALMNDTVVQPNSTQPNSTQLNLIQPNPNQSPTKPQPNFN